LWRTLDGIVIAAYLPVWEQRRRVKGAVTVTANTRALIEKIQALPQERLDEIEDFVDFIRLREQQRALTRDVAAASAPAFAVIWDNPEDDIYNAC
jgi:hypothetical protein